MGVGPIDKQLMYILDRVMYVPVRISLVGILLCWATGVWAAEAPVIPVGYDAYRMWNHWPYQRVGARAYMRSTYDRSGGNEGADASHFLYQSANDFSVTLDVSGSGALYFARYNHWHGIPWHYEVDGKDHIFQETSKLILYIRGKTPFSFLPNYSRTRWRGRGRTQWAPT